MPIYSNDTILKYLNFIYLRIKDNFKISDDEYENTYKYYKEYCKDNSLEIMPFQIFYRELKKVDIKSVQYSYPDGRRVRRRVFNLIDLEKMFDPNKPKPSEDTQAITMLVGGKWFKLIVKLQEINFSSNPDTSAIENNNV
jgi:hypothetical protein